MRLQSIPPRTMPNSFRAATHRAVRLRSRIALSGETSWPADNRDSRALGAFDGDEGEYVSGQRSHVFGRVQDPLELHPGPLSAGIVSANMLCVTKYLTELRFCGSMFLC